MVAPIIIGKCNVDNHYHLHFCFNRTWLSRRVELGLYIVVVTVIISSKTMDEHFSIIRWMQNKYCKLL